jgi:opacity protein-like surface antigen
MTIRRSLLAGTALALCVLAAPAQAGRPMYVTLGGGANLLQDANEHAVNPTSTHETLSFSPESNTGFVLHAAIGAHLDDWVTGLRAEVEGSYRQNNADGLWAYHTLFMFAPTGGALDFDESTWAVLANAWYDVNFGGSLHPYFGGGAGWGETRLKGERHTGFPPTSFNFTGDGFTWQLGGGLNWTISPSVTIGVGYRYVDGPDVDFLPANASDGAVVNVDQVSQSVTLDLSFDL